MATRIGAELLGEIIVTSMGVFLLYYEVSRQSLKDEKKHIRHREQRMLLDQRIESLDESIDRNEKEIRNMKAALDNYSESANCSD